MKKQIKITADSESYMDQFFDLYDEDEKAGMELEEIANDLGIEIWDMHTDMPIATEDDYREILETYRTGESVSNASTVDELCDGIAKALGYVKGVKSAHRLENVHNVYRFYISTNTGSYQLDMRKY